MSLKPIPEAEDDLPPFLLTSFDRMSFLVVDDDASCLSLLETMLRKAGVGAIRKAANVFAAVSALTEMRTAVDCIICDHHMEGMTGLALLQRIRAGRNEVVPRDTRFVMITGNSSHTLVQAACQLDVSGFLTKPCSVGAVLKAVHLAFSRPVRLKTPAEYTKLALPA